MKFAHPGLVFALGIAALLSGCATSHSTRSAARMAPARDFEVVETSARRPLTDREMAQIRAAVEGYLDKEGKTEAGDHYVKVYLTPEAEGSPSEWVVVRFTRYGATRMTYVTSYSQSYPYHTYGYYPFASSTWPVFGFEYYDYPYYSHRPHYPRRRHDRDHDGRHHGRRDHDRHPRGDGDSDRPHDRVTPGGGRPGTARTRWERPTPGSANPPAQPPAPPVVNPPVRRDPYPHRNQNPQWRGRAPDAGRPAARNAQPSAAPAMPVTRSEPTYSAPRNDPPVSRVPLSSPQSSETSSARYESSREAQARRRLE